jgi:hypothetical protein
VDILQRDVAAVIGSDVHATVGTQAQQLDLIETLGIHYFPVMRKREERVRGYLRICTSSFPDVAMARARKIKMALYWE